MSLINQKIIPATQIYRACGVSATYGRKVMQELERRAEIAPYRSSSGRLRLSFYEAERLARAL